MCCECKICKIDFKKQWTCVFNIANSYKQTWLSILITSE